MTFKDFQRPNDKFLYLAYGANLNIEGMRKRCPAAKRVGASYIEGTRLLFQGRRRDGNGVATIERCRNKHTPVGVWEITKACLESLDHFEGYPTLYRRTTVTFDLHGTPRMGIAYVMNYGRKTAPSAYYLNTIREGYQSFGFDQRFLDEAVEFSGG